MLTFDDSITSNDNDNNDQIEQHEPLTDPDSELQTLLMTRQIQNNKCQELNARLKEKNALLTRKLEYCQKQLNNFQTRENGKKVLKSFVNNLTQKYKN